MPKPSVSLYLEHKELLWLHGTVQNGRFVHIATFLGDAATFAAAIHQLSSEKSGPFRAVSVAELLAFAPYHRLGNSETRQSIAGRKFENLMEQFNQKAALDALIGTIDRKGLQRSGSFYWRPRVPVVVSDTLKKKLKGAGDMASAVIPSHSTPQLRTFLCDMNRATANFYDGQLKPAADAFEAICKAFDKRAPKRPNEADESMRYNVHASMWHFRCLHLLGYTQEAAKVLARAVAMCRRLRPSDPILEARGAYNNAWQHVSHPDEMQEPRGFASAARRILSAAPDDLRWGHLLGIQGRHAYRGFKRTLGSRETAISCARDAMRCFTHSAYLLCRAEDHWGMLEACWRVSDSLFRIGQHLRHKEWTADAPDLAMDNALSEIKAWLELTRDIQKKFKIRDTSVRADMLEARILLLHDQDYSAAINKLKKALEKIKDTEDDIEKGRIQRLLVDAHLLDNNESAAFEAYKLAASFWKNHEVGNKELKAFEVDEANKTVCRPRGRTALDQE